MVKVFIKGGVWKNSEDEILKAAVQKYGKQQWARVASLLNRKTAKQCKARWHEWLDPSVRKIEWTRQEEEKLLHLAKLMPAQWKTIAPLVGRTASQCQEHYEMLLDQAATATGKGNGDDSKLPAAGASGLRSYQPGQIDSHPETKPARPDPIDMDEDEIEMLQEARARLANTQGKKAKRKAREKMLQQAKRLADLQKRRELKQAGLLSKAARIKANKKRKRGGDIDLGVEIPFHKPAPAGFHDTSREDIRAEAIRSKHLKKVNYKKVNESQYRTRDREMAQNKKREEARMYALEKSNMQYVVDQVNQLNDPTSTSETINRNRGKMNLPQPMVTDKELTQLSKMQQQHHQQQIEASSAAAAMTTGDTEGAAATTALLGDYSNRPLPTPMRTPMTVSGSSAKSSQQAILREASKLRMLERRQTPLLGTSAGDSQPQQDPEDEDDEQDHIQHYETSGAPTPRLPPNRETSSTPATVATAATHRDQLGLNRPVSELRSCSTDRLYIDDNASIGASTFATNTTMSIKEIARQERRAARRARMELEQALKALPAPQFEYELSIPQNRQLDDDDDDERMKLEPDAADIDKQREIELREKARKSYEKRSSVLKRKDLPRVILPCSAQEISMTLEHQQRSSALALKEKLVQEEMIKLVQYDAYEFPLEKLNDDGNDEKNANKTSLGTTTDEATTPSSDTDKKKKKNKKRKNTSSFDDDDTATDNSTISTSTFTSANMVQPIELDYISEEAVDRAKELVKKEFDSLLEQKITMFRSATNVDEDYDLAKTVLADVNSKVSQLSCRSAGSDDVDTLKDQLSILQKQTLALHKKNNKLESKLNIKNNGYYKLKSKAGSEIREVFFNMQNSNIEYDIYKNVLHKQETLGAEYRILSLENDINQLQHSEIQLQNQYASMMRERKLLLLKKKQQMQ